MRNVFDIRQLILSLTVLAVLAILATFAFSQQPPPVPAYPQPQAQQAPAYAVPARGPLPWIRWHVFGRPTYDLYVPVGQPFQATVAPVAPVGRRR